jgi:hypothetical protein
MTLRVLYIEDEIDHYELLKDAIEEQNQKIPVSSRVELDHALTPDKLSQMLDDSIDVILADVVFESAPGPDNNPNRLDEIIKTVDGWMSHSRRGRPLPVIALTGKGKRFVEFCLSRKESLYDIWDKAAASPEYRAWRLSQLAIELPRFRPDALMQLLVSKMTKGARWHEHVVDMVRRYDSGRTEADQVERAGEAVRHIADGLGSLKICSEAWDTMVRAEPLIRAACPSTRGHARHVLNVFWMGYFLIYHEALRRWVEKIWEGIVNNRSWMGPVSKVDPLEALGDIWFYASIFHDFAYLLEKSNDVQICHLDILPNFGELANVAIEQFDCFARELPTRLKQFIRNEFDDPTKENSDPDSPCVAALKQVCKQGFSTKSPDHGLMSALHFRNLKLSDKQQICLLREAARAMALHHVVCAANESEVRELLSWDQEPLACLLLLCDQLETWGRERHDNTYRHDLPQRAELAYFKIADINGRPQVEIAIDYIAPAHLEKSPEIFGRVKDDLDRILAEHPKLTLEKLSDEWPFNLEVSYTMSGVAMSTKISLPRNRTGLQKP